MADRIPLIVNPTASQIQELPSGDSLNGIVNITATGTIQAEQITSTDDMNATGTVTANLFVGGGMVPLGAILMWSGTGSATAVPTGFTLCNGNGGAAVNGITIPDLRDKFIVGANAVTGSDSTYPGVSMNQTGGNADATLVSHEHTTDSIIETGSTSAKSLTGAITKISEGFNAEGTATGVFTKTSDGNNDITGSSSTSPVSGVTMDVNHRHSTDTQGSAATNANLPPYFALAYIMRTT